MEQSQQVEVGQHENPSYWASVLIGAVIFGIISAAAQLILSYAAINGGGGQSNWIGSVICLIVGFAGMVAIWHYVNEYDLAVSLGKGALIGFLAGALAQLIGFGIIEIWKWLDPQYVQSMKQMKIAAIQNNDNIPDQYKQKALDYVNHPRALWTIAGLAISVIGTGIISLITGMIGAKIFSREEEL